jgi:hypothetical protein
MSDTLLEISGMGIAPYSARGLTQTLTPIGAASVQRRTINGALDDLSRDQFRKFASKISCTDQTTPAIDGIWPGMELTVDCVVELVAPTGSPLSRTPVPGSQRMIGAFTAYRPRLTMRVTNYNASLGEYEGDVQWELDLEEV